MKGSDPTPSPPYTAWRERNTDPAESLKHGVRWKVPRGVKKKLSGPDSGPGGRSSWHEFQRHAIAQPGGFRAVVEHMAEMAAAAAAMHLIPDQAKVQSWVVSTWSWHKTLVMFKSRPYA